jgi:hypothetical protein
METPIARIPDPKAKAASELPRAKRQPRKLLHFRMNVVEAAGIETCAAATRSLSFQVLTLPEAGVRVECKRSGCARPQSPGFSFVPYFSLISS